MEFRNTEDRNYDQTGVRGGRGGGSVSKLQNLSRSIIAHSFKGLAWLIALREHLIRNGCCNSGSGRQWEGMRGGGQEGVGGGEGGEVRGGGGGLKRKGAS